jgi:hypothetical protein
MNAPAGSNDVWLVIWADDDAGSVLYRNWFTWERDALKTTEQIPVGPGDSLTVTPVPVLRSADTVVVQWVSGVSRTPPAGDPPPARPARVIHAGAEAVAVAQQPTTVTQTPQGWSVQGTDIAEVIAVTQQLREEHWPEHREPTAV